MATLAELIAQRAELEKQIADTQKTQRAEAIAKVKALMAEYGLAASDLSTRAASSPDKVTKKVAAKYRDPKTGDSWTGRGLKPKWLKAAIDSGATLESFAV